jgi:hypothetical protein
MEKEMKNSSRTIIRRIRMKWGTYREKQEENKKRRKTRDK